MQTYLTLPIQPSLPTNSNGGRPRHIKRIREKRVPPQHSSRQTNRQSPPGPPSIFFCRTRSSRRLVSHLTPAAFSQSIQASRPDFQLLGKGKGKGGGPTYTIPHDQGGRAAAAAPQPTKQTNDTRQDKTRQASLSDRHTPPHNHVRCPDFVWLPGLEAVFGGPSSAAGKEGRHLGRRSSRPPLTLGLACSLQRALRFAGSRPALCRPRPFSAREVGSYWPGLPDLPGLICWPVKVPAVGSGCF
jgi:hypothetical protein